MVLGEGEITKLTISELINLSPRVCHDFKLLFIFLWTGGVCLSAQRV